MEIAHIQTPLGIAKITGGEGISYFCFRWRNYFDCNTPVLQAAVTQLNEYFEGKRHSFSWILKELNSNKSMESVIRYSIW
jgi:methylated-DNA-[protein]-cysteine S-methyltransferase